MDRRKFLVGIATAAPTLTITGRWVAGTPAAAQIPGLPSLPGLPGGDGSTIPGITESDFYDLGDSLAQASAVTMALLEITISEEGRPVFKLPRQEVGQGVNTMVAMFIAEELGISPDQVDLTLEDSRFDLLTNQLTGGSYNARAFYQPVSKMAAAAREMLMAAAAQEMGVDRSVLSLDNGRVVGPDGQMMSFGQLTGIASQLQFSQSDLLPEIPQIDGATVPGGPTQQLLAATRAQDPAAKPVAEQTLLGTRQIRTDARSIVTGAKDYAVDLDFEGVTPAVAVHSPRVRSLLVSFDNEEAIRNMPGVIDVVAIRAIPQLGLGEDPAIILDPTANTAIVIAAETMGHALEAADAVQATWTDGPVGDMSDTDFFDDFRAQGIPLTPLPTGDVNVQHEIEWAHYAHAPMETMDAVCKLNEDGSLDIFSGLKIPQPAQQEIAEVLLMSPLDVRVHCVDSGGSFGRRLFHETSLEAAVASVAMGRSLKLMWSRQEDTRNDRLKPACLTKHQMSAVSATGTVTSMETRYTGGETNLNHGFGDLLTSIGAHDPATQIIVGQSIFALQVTAPFNFGLTSQLMTEIDYNMLTGSWRSVYTQPVSSGESMLAELMAAELGEDPIEFRIRHAKEQALKDCLAWVRDNGGYGRSLPSGVFQGVGGNSEHLASMGCIVELDMNGERPKVTRGVMAIDCGIPFNISGIEAQALGGLNDAIATALQAGIHIDNGAVRESSFSDYFYTRHADYPRDVELHVFPAREGAGPSGFGEGSVPTWLGAIANALYHATGTMPNRFPINF